MKSLHFYIGVSGLAILFLLTGCAQASNPPTDQPLNTNTAIPTVTPIASVTMTPSQTITPVPPPTRRATFTLEANLTGTATPIASLTRKPTSNATRTPTGSTPTPTLFVVKIRIGGTQMTPTKVPFKCSIASSYPSEGQTFKPRTDFVAKWKVVNSGTNMWHKDDILFGFVEGKKMHNPSRVDKILDYTLYVGDHMDVEIHMRPPKEPGIYSETWGLRKTNKKEFFCLLTVTIEVVKK